MSTTFQKIAASVVSTIIVLTCMPTRSSTAEEVQSTKSRTREIAKMDPVIHFELPAEDNERISTFYGSAFGWQTTPLGPDAGNFVLAFTTEVGEDRVPRKVGAINGGFFPRTNQDQEIKLTILVDDIRDAMQRIEEAGGRVLGEPFELPGVGLFVSFADTEGNVLTINQDYSVKRLPDAE